MARSHDMDRALAAPSAGWSWTAASPGPAQVIDLRAPQEVSAWAQLLGCTEERLRRAVAAVGPELPEVCNHLGTLLPAQALNLAAGRSHAH